jgi:hypothetical protein
MERFNRRTLERMYRISIWLGAAISIPFAVLIFVFITPDADGAWDW